MNRNPSPKHQVLKMVTAPDTGRKLAHLDCGHELPMRTAWPGKWRWCATCNPPRASKPVVDVRDIIMAAALSMYERGRL